MAELSRGQILKNPEVLGVGNTGAKIRLLDADENSHIDIKVPDTVGTAYTFTLPSDDGTPDQYLKTDGSGTTSWASVSAIPGGTTRQLQYNNAGAFAGAAVTTEGTNLYLTSGAEVRFNDADNSNYVGIAASSVVTANRSYKLPDTVGTAGQVLKIASSPAPTSTSASLIWATDETGGAGSSPGGVDTYVQFNDGGSTFGGDAGLTYNKTTDVLSVTGGINLGTIAATYKINGVDRITNINVGTANSFFTSIYGTNLYLRNPSDGDVSIRYISSVNSLDITHNPTGDQFGIGTINISAGIGPEASTNGIINLQSEGGGSINITNFIDLNSGNLLRFNSPGFSLFRGLDSISIDTPTTIISGYTITLPDSAGAANEVLQYDASQNASFVSNTRTLNFLIDGGGSAITTGIKGHVVVDGDYTVTGWTIIADQSGSIVVDVNRATFTNFPTTTSIAGTELPTLSSAQKAEDLTLTTWTTTISARDVLEFQVDSATTVTRVTVALRLVPR